MIESPAIMIDFFLAGSAVVVDPLLAGGLEGFWGLLSAGGLEGLWELFFLPCWFDFMPRRSIATWVPLEITA